MWTPWKEIRIRNLHREVDKALEPLFVFRAQLETNQILKLKAQIDVLKFVHMELVNNHGKVEAQVIKDRWLACRLESILDLYKKALDQTYELLNHIPEKETCQEYEITYYSNDN